MTSSLSRSASQPSPGRILDAPLEHRCPTELLLDPAQSTLFCLGSTELTLAVQEFHGSQVDTLYEAITAYLNSKGNQDVHRLLASLPRNSTKVTFTMAREAQTTDTYRCCALSSISSTAAHLAAAE